MKKIVFYFLEGVFAVALCACTGNKNEVPTTDKEEVLQAAMAPYVRMVVDTYRGMSDEAIELAEACRTMLAHYDAGTLVAADVRVACDAWNACRNYWEESEAFLFGPAANHNIDPHIDSWPLDQNAMLSMLNDERLMTEIETQGGEYVGNNLGYGLLGFHAIEYNLFELVDDGNSSRLHDISTYTRPQLVYLVAVAEDLCNQCVCLEACWAGTANVSSIKRELLELAELDYNEHYGNFFADAGKAGSVYVTYQDAAEEIVQGCIDIIDEVGNTKIGKPNGGASEEDRNYIESPYSLNSINDFVGNIISVRNAYCGVQDGDNTLSSYVQVHDAGLDSRVRAAIEEAIAAIRAIPEPFAKNATTAAADEAIEKLAVLQALFEKEILAIITK